MNFKEATELREGRFDKFVKFINRLHPLKRFVDSKQEQIGKENAEKIQQYLFRLGYVRGDLMGVDYDFFHPLKTDQDWSWTFDITEWKWDESQSQESFLNTIFKRLESEDPEDVRGKFAEKTGIQQMDKVDIVLFHDRDETNLFFKPIIERLISMEVRFLPVEYNQIKQA